MADTDIIAALRRAAELAVSEKRVRTAFPSRQEEADARLLREHAERLPAFMETVQRIADLPDFDRYRQYDPRGMAREALTHLHGER